MQNEVAFTIILNPVKLLINELLIKGKAKLYLLINSHTSISSESFVTPGKKTVFYIHAIKYFYRYNIPNKLGD